MRLYILRHGETEWNKIKRLQGRSNVSLNEYGRELARITANALADVDFNYIYSSPLDRAYETATILKMNRDVDIIKDDRLVEICFGSNEGCTPDNISPDFHLFFDKPEDYVPAPGGETYEELCKRSQDFLREVIIPLSLREPDANVLITAHGALNKSLIIYLKHLEIKNMWDGVFQKNCCVNIFDINGYNFRLIEEAKIYY